MHNRESIYLTNGIKYLKVLHSINNVVLSVVPISIINALKYSVMFIILTLQFFNPFLLKSVASTPGKLSFRDVRSSAVLNRMAAPLNEKLWSRTF